MERDLAPIQNLLYNFGIILQSSHTSKIYMNTTLFENTQQKSQDPYTSFYKKDYTKLSFYTSIQASFLPFQVPFIHAAHPCLKHSIGLHIHTVPRAQQFFSTKYMKILATRLISSMTRKEEHNIPYTSLPYCCSTTIGFFPSMTNRDVKTKYMCSLSLSQKVFIHRDAP